MIIKLISLLTFFYFFILLSSILCLIPYIILFNIQLFNILISFVSIILIFIFSNYYLIARITSKKHYDDFIINESFISSNILFLFYKNSHI